MFSLKLIKSICSLNEQALVSVARYAPQISQRWLKLTLGKPLCSTHEDTLRGCEYVCLCSV